MAENRECSSASSCSKESCEGCSSSGQKTSFAADMNQYSSVKKVIGVVSGKGGVGKSFVTASLAAQMRKKGYSVGILDADITGPSIPKMFGVHGPAVGNDMGMYPIEAEDGTKIMSINLLMDDEEAPETGDVPLTVFQSLPVDGIVIVTSPQELVQMIVKKAYNMAGMMHIPVLGVVENYSYFECPDCGKRISLFGESHVDEVAKELGIDVLGKLPLDPKYAQAADEGRFYELENPHLEAGVEKIGNI